MDSGILLFVSYASNLVTQWLDSNLTSIGLTHGFKEANPVTRFLMAKLGNAGTNFIKIGAVPFAAMVIGMISHHPEIGYVGNSVIAAVTLPVVVKNVLLLKKNKIKISLF